MPPRTQSVPELRQFNTEIEWLLKSHNPRARSLFSFIRRTLGQFHLEKVCSDSEVFNEAYRRGIDFIMKGNRIYCVNAWIRKTSYNVIREFSRDRKRFHSMESKIMERVMASRLLVSEAVIERDLEAVSLALQQIMQSLSRGDRLILCLRTFENSSWKQVAQCLIELGEEPQSEAALRKRGQRIMQRMRCAYHEIRPREPFEFD